jgi:NAD kinase
MLLLYMHLAMIHPVLSFSFSAVSTRHQLNKKILRFAESDPTGRSSSNEETGNVSKSDRNGKATGTRHDNIPKNEIILDESFPHVKRIPSLLDRTSGVSSTTPNGNNNKNNNVISGSSSSGRKMSLLWCQSDRCVDVVRERVIGEHNQIVLNGPATGQVAYRWNKKVSQKDNGSSSEKNVETRSSSGTLPSVLLLVKQGDEALLRIASDNVPKLTDIGINVLMAPDLAAKLKHYYGVDDQKISLFEPPKDSNEEKWRVRYMDDDEDEWFEDMKYVEPFPDLVVTVGGDGLLIYASMLFQGPVPPLLAIAGGSLGFLTPFAEHEMVDAVKTALGIVTDDDGEESPSDVSSIMDANTDDLQVFPPNMPSYPYAPLAKTPRGADGIPKFTLGLGDFICMTIRMRLDCRIVNREGVVRARYNVLNEVVIDRGSSPYLAALECFCDDVHLTTVQADGVIFAT